MPNMPSGAVEAMRSSTSGLTIPSATSWSLPPPHISSELPHNDQLPPESRLLKSSEIPERGRPFGSGEEGGIRGLGDINEKLNKIGSGEVGFEVLEMDGNPSGAESQDGD
jgi:hypothetical protein